MIGILESLLNKYFPTIMENEKECSAEIKAERAVPSQSVPSPFTKDIEALQREYGELKTGMQINLSLHQALDLMPRNRKRSDAYKGLKSELMKLYGVALNVGGQHTGNNQYEQETRDD